MNENLINELEPPWTEFQSADEWRNEYEFIYNIFILRFISFVT